MSKYIPKVWTILISRDLMNQKVVLHPPPTIHPHPQFNKKSREQKSGGRRIKSGGMGYQFFLEKIPDFVKKI